MQTALTPADFAKMPMDRLQAIIAGADTDLRSHHARIIADREICLRSDMAGRCATCRQRDCACSADAWLGAA